MMISRSGNVDQRCLDPLIKATNKDQDRGLNACIPPGTQFNLVESHWGLKFIK